MLLTIECVLIAVLSATLFVSAKFRKIDFQKLGPTSVNDISEAAMRTLNGYTNIALFGIDNRSNGNFDSGQSDVIMVCSINNDTKEIRLASIYRDTIMDVDGSGKYRKCNYAYAHGGAKEAIDMLNRNLDLDIDDFVAVDFRAVTEAVDAVGGIDLGITEDELNPPGHHPGINAYIEEVADVTGKKAHSIQGPGPLHADGVQATAYCRLRYTASMDFGRAARQRIVLQKLFAAVHSASPKELGRLVDSLFPCISTSFSPANLLQLAGAVKDYTIAGTTGYPFKKSTATPSNTIGSVVVPCDAASNVSELHKWLFTESGTGISSEKDEAEASSAISDSERSSIVNDSDVSSTVKRISSGIEEITELTAEDAVDFDPAYEDASGDSVSK